MRTENTGDDVRQWALRWFEGQRDQHEWFPLVPHIVRLLAEGQPVALDRLAAAAGWSAADVEAALRRQPGTDWDDQGRLVGFGLTLRPTPHRFTFAGRTVYAFCASDALEFPVILGRSGVVESTCPATGQQVRVGVTPERVTWVEPASAVVSLVRPDQVDDVRAEVCALGSFFASHEAGAEWLAAHPEGMVHGVEEDFHVHREINEKLGWAAHARNCCGPVQAGAGDVERVRNWWGLQQERFPGFQLIPHLARLLAEGEPVPLERLAGAASWLVADVEAALHQHPGVDWDEAGRLVGFGLTLRPTPHQFSFEGRTVYGFCASDVLGFPVVLGRSGVIRSKCPATGQGIRVEVTPERVNSVDPPIAVVSLVRPDTFQDIRTEGCDLGWFFASVEAAAEWRAAHPEGMVHGVEEEFQQTREMMFRVGWALTRSGRS